MAARYVVFFTVVALVMGSVHYWIWARLVRDAALPAPWSRVLTIVIGALFVLLMSGFVVFRALPRSIGAPIMWIAYTWLGVVFFLTLSLGASELARLFALRPKDPGVPI